MEKTTLDLINSLGFELFSCLFISLNLISLYRDKTVKGMSSLSMLFYMTWALWNIYYFFSLNQLVSGWLAVCYAILCVWWTIVAVYYRHKNK